MLHKALWVQKSISEPVHLPYSLWILWVGRSSLESLAVMICIIILHTAKHLGVEPAATVDEVVLVFTFQDQIPFMQLSYFHWSDASPLRFTSVSVKLLVVFWFARVPPWISSVSGSCQVWVCIQQHASSQTSGDVKGRKYGVNLNFFLYNTVNDLFRKCQCRCRRFNASERRGEKHSQCHCINIWTTSTVLKILESQPAQWV